KQIPLFECHHKFQTNHQNHSFELTSKQFYFRVNQASFFSLVV
ncbi:hypothetical protein VCHENC02_1884B, partial [Vibrio harveyi]